MRAALGRAAAMGLGKRRRCWRPRNRLTRAADQRRAAWILAMSQQIAEARAARGDGDAARERRHLTAARRLLALVIRANAMQHPKGRRGVLEEIGVAGRGR